MFFASVNPYKSLMETFVGSSQNKISSGSLKKQMKGFTVAAVKDTCPEEKASALQQASFITSKQKDSNDLLEMITKINKHKNRHNFKSKHNL